MNEIRCPQCGKVFTIDENSYAAIVQQVRDKEFDKRVTEEKNAAVRLAQSEKDQEIQALRVALEQQQEKAAAEKAAALQEAAAAYTEKVSALNEKLAVADAQKTIAVQQAVSEQEKKQHEQNQEILELQNRIARMEDEFRLEQKQLEAQQALVVRQKDEEIAYYKDLKTRQSTKMVGETLEQHCSIEFNKLRAAAFPHAYFEKDNDAQDGTKGDFIFRDFDETGMEYISIMFEMKNEMDDTVQKHKNEDFLKKLDKDRNTKKCEYAVLVSMLEADNEFYNTGIVDMSYRYPKMYVIRPQFFIPMITLLRNAAQNGLEFRRELAAAKSQSMDVEAFNEQLTDFKTRFSRSYQLASERFSDAIAEIDKTIKELEKVKENLRLSAEHLHRANSRAEDLTIKRLTRGNPTLAGEFQKAGIDIK